MSNRRVILILLSGILICISLLWLVHRRERYFPVPGKARVKLAETPMDKVEQIIVDHGVARIGLVKINGHWNLTAPFAARVDQGAVARLLDGFESARVMDALGFKEIRRRELSLRDFCLAPPRTRVELSGPQGRVCYLFGTFTPLGTDVYVQISGLDQVLTVAADLFESLPRTADEVRSRRLVHAQRPLARSVEIRMPGNPFLKLMRVDGTWRLTQPAPGPAADQRVGALLDLLLDNQVEQFVWPSVSNVMDVAESDAAFKTRLELYGLGAESEIEVQVETQGGTTERVVFGKRVDGTEGLSYVLLSGANAIGTVSNRIVRAFRLKPADLRDPRIFSEMQGMIRRIQIQFEDTHYALMLTNGVWKIESPVADVADQQRVVGMLDRLLRLEAADMEEVAVKNGMSADTLCHVVLQGAQRETRFSVRRYESSGEMLRLTMTNTPAVYLVPGSNVPPALLSEQGLLLLRDKTMLSLPVDRVRRVTLRRADGRRERIVRDNEHSVWHADRKTPGVPVPDNIKSLLALLTSLQAVRIEKLGVSASTADIYGLQQPWLEVSVDVDTADSVRKTVVIGKSCTNGRYAAVRGLDVVFVLGDDAIKTLSASLLTTR